MSDVSRAGEEVRAAEVIAALCLATDLGMGLPFEHGLHSTLVAMRLGERLGIDAETASQTYYACLLFYVGCTVDAHVSSEIFANDTALVTHFTPSMFGSRSEVIAGIMRALAPPGSAPLPVRAVQIARLLPRAVSGHRRHLVALCEVAQMLTDRLGLPASLHGLWAHLTERWDGRGEPGRLSGDDIPLPLRIVHVARDAAFQCLLGGEERAGRVVWKRAGGAFDPRIAGLLADEAAKILAFDGDRSAWERTLDAEPMPRVTLDGDAVDRALAAMGDFADLASPYLAGHSAGTAELATAAARVCRIGAADLVSIRRAAFVHDLGRVAIPVRIWQKPGPLTADEWERVRLHAYHSERVLSRSSFLAALAPVATSHHERLDGSGSPLDYAKHDYGTVIADLLSGVLSALGIDRAYVVGSSIGNLWALRLATKHPSRVDAIVLLGGGPLVPEISVPPFIRLLASPVGAVVVRLPMNRGRVCAMLRQSGHGGSLAAGRIPDAFLDWRVTLHRDTDSMRSERDMVRAAVRGRALRPGFTFDDATLAQVRQPALLVYGTSDPVGSAHTWRRVVGLMPRAEMRIVEGGHVPWLDDPAQVAGAMRRFLA